MCGICQRQIVVWYNEMLEINPFVAALFLRASDCVNCCILLIPIWKSARLLLASLEGAKTLMAATVMRWSVPISSLDKDNPSSSACSAPVRPGASICWLPVAHRSRAARKKVKAGRNRRSTPPAMLRAVGRLGSTTWIRLQGSDTYTGVSLGWEKRPFERFLRTWGLIQARVPTSNSSSALSTGSMWKLQRWHARLQQINWQRRW